MVADTMQATIYGYFDLDVLRYQIIWSYLGKFLTGPEIRFVVWLGLDFPLPALACSSIANSSPIIEYTSRVTDNNNDDKAITIHFPKEKKKKGGRKRKRKEN